MLINLRMLSFVNNDNGTLTIELPERHLTEQESDVLDALFPHCSEELAELLQKECLLGCIATKAEVKADADNVQRQGHKPRKSPRPT